jgi:hypothetical protein
MISGMNRFDRRSSPLRFRPAAVANAIDEDRVEVDPDHGEKMVEAIEKHGDEAVDADFTVAEEKSEAQHVDPCVDLAKHAGEEASSAKARVFTQPAFPDSHELHEPLRGDVDGGCGQRDDFSPRQNTGKRA